MRIDEQTLICHCNNLRVKDIISVINENSFTTLKELLEQDISPMGDKCKACIDEGYENDGLNIPMVLSMQKSNRTF